MSNRRRGGFNAHPNTTKNKKNKKMNDIVFIKGNGGMGRKAANADIISGLLMGMRGKIDPTTDLKKGFIKVVVGTETLYIAEIKNYLQLKDLFGIEPTEWVSGVAFTDSQICANAIDYHVSEFFRMSPTGKLWLAIKVNDEITGDDIKTLQYQAIGEIRQVSVLTTTTDLATTVSKYQKAATELETEHQPLSIVIVPNKAEFCPAATSTVPNPLPEIEYLQTENYKDEGCCNVSILVSGDRDPKLLKRISDDTIPDAYFADFGCAGTILGTISAAKVNECIAWVGKFPLKLKQPGFITGELLKDVSLSKQDDINKNRYIFVRHHAGKAGNWFNDSFTLDLETSDYTYIENVRTMDKATRGVRANLLDYLNSPLKVDAKSGKIDTATVAVLENVAGKALEDMEKAGELSGYKVVIDPDQDVIATSTVVVSIVNVPMGVMRDVEINIGYSKSI